MEKIQAQEMMSGLRIPEMDEFGHFFHSLPTSTLLGIGALTAVLAYWFATRPQAIQPPCNLQHQSEEVPVGQMIRYQHTRDLKGVQTHDTTDKQIPAFPNCNLLNDLNEFQTTALHLERVNPHHPGSISSGEKQKLSPELGLTDVFLCDSMKMEVGGP